MTKEFYIDFNGQVEKVSSVELHTLDDLLKTLQNIFRNEFLATGNEYGLNRLENATLATTHFSIRDDENDNRIKLDDVNQIVDGSVLEVTMDDESELENGGQSASIDGHNASQTARAENGSVDEKEILRRELEELKNKMTRIEAERDRGRGASPTRSSKRSRSRSRDRESSSGTFGGTDEERLEASVRIRGLPYGASSEDVADFFKGLKLILSTVLCIPLNDRPPGEAYATFETVADAKLAKQRHKNAMGRRFIEVFAVREIQELKDIDIRGITLDEANARLAHAHDWEKDWRPSDGYVIRARGLPWSSTPSEIVKFFAPANVQEENVKFVTTAAGKPTGEAFVKVGSREDMQLAMEKNRKLINDRYIELIKSTLREFDNPNERAEWPRLGAAAFSSHDSGRPRGEREGRRGDRDGGGGGGGRHTERDRDHRGPESFISSYGRGFRASPHGGPAVGTNKVVRLRGLPYNVSERDVFEFFKTIPIAGIHIMCDSTGLPTGDAYVEMPSAEEEERAVRLHRQSIGRRYIEVYRVAPPEMVARLNEATPFRKPSRMDERDRDRGRPHERGGGRGGPIEREDARDSPCLRARGIPWEATEDDVIKFFSQCGFPPISLHRQSGEAFVEYARPEHCTAALSLHNGLIGHRYIEIMRVSYNEMARIVGLPNKNEYMAHNMPPTNLPGVHPAHLGHSTLPYGNPAIPNPATAYYDPAYSGAAYPGALPGGVPQQYYPQSSYPPPASNYLPGYR